ncbi:hypothetical protein CAOG_007064 [Capsaspora owczarzaki ATCC 30864]|uniref:Bromo domain-containing protein n=2 Tax=Capsaspora owczarzaki (strain ATCC 30864) TaxID=595528 RepID=A0A0D2WVC5_CAPO3|nr:hypothetical protein CAOG_007064 [Capsaspora owczarzaki ATCC 30864]
MLPTLFPSFSKSDVPHFSDLFAPQKFKIRPSRAFVRSAEQEAELGDGSDDDDDDLSSALRSTEEVAALSAAAGADGQVPAPLDSTMTEQLPPRKRPLLEEDWDDEARLFNSPVILPTMIRHGRNARDTVMAQAIDAEDIGHPLVAINPQAQPPKQQQSQQQPPQPLPQLVPEQLDSDQSDAAKQTPAMVEAALQSLKEPDQRAYNLSSQIVWEEHVITDTDRYSDAKVVFEPTDPAMPLYRSKPSGGYVDLTPVSNLRQFHSASVTGFLNPYEPLPKYSILRTLHQHAKDVAAKLDAKRQADEHLLTGKGLAPIVQDVTGETAQARAFLAAALAATPTTQKGRAASQRRAHAVAHLERFNAADTQQSAGGADTIDIKEPTVYSMFPLSNMELAAPEWEDEIIYDETDAPKRLPNTSFIWDKSDGNLLYGSTAPKTLKFVKSAEEIAAETRRRTKKMSWRARQREKERIQREKAAAMDAKQIAAMQGSDRFNLSGDQWYRASSGLTADLFRSSTFTTPLRHSLPALKLLEIFFHTSFTQASLRCAHRPVLKTLPPVDGNEGGRSCTLASLGRFIKKKEHERLQERQKSGGDVFFMKTQRDLSGRDGDIVLLEYCEEFPPLVSNVGMVSRLYNLYRRTEPQDDNAPELPFGMTRFQGAADSSPFLGQLKPGSALQYVDNTLYLAPAYPHEIAPTDFLVIRVKDHHYIRPIDGLFVLGQTLPKIEVPAPNSKKASDFMRNRVQAFIYRQLKQSKLSIKKNDKSRRPFVKLGDLIAAFPSIPVAMLRKRLKILCECVRSGLGDQSEEWELRTNQRIPPEEELRQLVTPEQACAHESMLASQQMLRDSGFGADDLILEPPSLTPDGDEEDQDQRIQTELKLAPWNTTHTFLDAQQGKCHLKLTGPGDPTGAGEGFSYIRAPSKPIVHNREREAAKPKQKKEPHKTVEGTESDLRKIPLVEARNMLQQKFGISLSQTSKMPRWDVIALLRKMSSSQGEGAADATDLSKWARGERRSVQEHQQLYKQECQRLFDLQNRILASSEELESETESVGDGDGDEGGDDFDDLADFGKELESAARSSHTEASALRSMEARSNEIAEYLQLHKLLKRSQQAAAGGDEEQDGQADMDTGADGDAQAEEATDMQTESAGADGAASTSSSSSAAPPASAASVPNQQPGEKYRGKHLVIKRKFAMPDGSVAERQEVVTDPRVIEAYLIVRNQELAGVSEGRRRKLLSHVQRRLAASQSGDNNSLGASRVPTGRTNRCGMCGSYEHTKSNRACPEHPEHLTFQRSRANAAARKRAAQTGVNTDDIARRFAQSELARERDQSASQVVFGENGLKMKIKFGASGAATPTAASGRRPPSSGGRRGGRGGSSARKSPKSRRVRFRGDYDDDDEDDDDDNVGNSDEDEDEQNDFRDEEYDAFRSVASKRRGAVTATSQLNKVLMEVCQDLWNHQSSTYFRSPVDVHQYPDYLQHVHNPMDLTTMRAKAKGNNYQRPAEFLEDLALLVINSSAYNGHAAEVTTAAFNLMQQGVKQLRSRSQGLMEATAALGIDTGEFLKAAIQRTQAVYNEHCTASG